MAEVVKKSAGRAWLSSMLIIVAMVLTPIAVVTHWATAEVTNTERFVETLAPLADNPEIQQVIIDEVVGLIEKEVDIPAITESLFTGLGEALNLPDSAKKALELISTPVANGVDALITNVVTNVVESDAFQTAWTKTLTLTQQQAVALLEGNPDSVIKLSNNGTLSLPLKPIIADVKAELVKQGVGFANAIPEVDTTIELGRIPELAVARVIYQIGTGIGTWLPWIVAAMLALGVVVARNRPRALMATSIVFAAVMAVMALAFGSGRVVALTVINSDYAAAVAVAYDALVSYVFDMVVSLIVLAIFLAVAGWAFGRSESADKFRAFANKQMDTLRRLIDPQNNVFSSISPTLHKFRILARVVILALFAWIAASDMPLTPGAVVIYTISALALLFIYEVLQRGIAAPAVAAAAPVAPTPAPAKPAAKKTTASAAAKKTVATPAVKKPAASATKKPAAKKAVASKPVAKKSTTKKS